MTIKHALSLLFGYAFGYAAFYLYFTYYLVPRM